MLKLFLPIPERLAPTEKTIASLYQALATRSSYWLPLRKFKLKIQMTGESQRFPELQPVHGSGILAGFSSQIWLLYRCDMNNL